MLSVKSRTSGRRVETAARTFLLEKLQEKGYTPLIRSMRLAAYEQALGGPERVREMERLLAAWSEPSEGAPGADLPFVRGDLFLFDTHAFFLLFGGTDGSEGMRAGVVYGAEAAAPERELETFCRNVDDAADLAARGVGTDASAPKSSNWQARAENAPESFTRFASGGTDDGGAQAPAEASPRAGETAERMRAVEALEDADVRRLLRRLNDAQAEGRTSEMLMAAGREGEPLSETLVGRLASTGLVRRELLISCRKDGRSLFRLPSADALAVMTASNAVCSECGAAVADERAEELVTPTPLAGAMLKDGAWLISRLRSVLGELGVGASGVAARAGSAESDALMMANVGGEPFLFVLRDGDFTLAHARRAIDVEADTEVAHLVVVSTGKIQEDARARMREHQKRRARTVGELDLLLVEGVDGAAAELRQAAERVTQRSLAAELYELDSGLGMSAGHFVAARFRLGQQQVALQDLAASAAGAITGSLREI
jgi:hypothetical protein